MSRLWEGWTKVVRGVRIDFQGEAQRKLKLTFDFLLGVSCVFVTAILLWSLAVGFGAANLALTTGGLGLGNVLFAPFAFLANSLGAAGASLMVAAGGGLVGALLGFLFGLPRRAGTGEPLPGADGKPVASGWAESSNLNQIADWLTKIIVGVGLVQAQEIIGWFGRLSRDVAAVAFVYVLPVATSSADPGKMLGAGAVVPALIVCSLALGFVFAYLLTALFLAELMAVAGQALGQLREQAKAEVRGELDAAERTASDATAEADRRKREAEAANAEAERRAREAEAAREAQRAAEEAQRLAAESAKERLELVNQWRRMDLNRLLDPLAPPELMEITGLQAFADSQFDACKTEDEKRAWAKANLAFGRRAEALAALAALAHGSGNFSLLQEAYKLAVHERDRDRAQALAAEIEALTPEQRRAASATSQDQFDFARVNEALYRDGGWREALGILGEMTAREPAFAVSGTWNVLRAAALGQRLKAEGATMPADERRQLLADADTAVRAALKREQRDWLRYLADPDHPTKAGVPEEQRDNDLVELVAELPELRTELGL